MQLSAQTVRAYESAGCRCDIRERVRLGVSSFAVACLGMGCAEPAYPDAQSHDAGGAGCDAGNCAPVMARMSEDGGAPDFTAPDGTLPDAALPPGTAELSGQHAVRIRYFARDYAKTTTFPHELVMLANIHGAPGAEALELDLQLCSHHWQIQSFYDWDVDIVAPDKYPLRQYSLYYESDHFYTTGGAQFAGYDPAPVPNCPVGSTQPRRSDQVWISSNQCDCPDLSAPPSSADDCRVTDPDMDEQPGFSVRQVSTAGTVVSYTRVLDNSQILNGTVSSDGQHMAQYSLIQDFYVYGCSPSNVTCLNGSFTSCAKENQPVLFSKLAQHASGAAWSCDEIQVEYSAGRLFDASPLTFPSGC